MKDKEGASWQSLKLHGLDLLDMKALEVMVMDTIGEAPLTTKTYGTHFVPSSGTLNSLASSPTSILQSLIVAYTLSNCHFSFHWESLAVLCKKQRIVVTSIE